MAPHTTNCKHLTQSSSARDWQRQAKHKSKAHIIENDKHISEAVNSQKRFLQEMDLNGLKCHWILVLAASSSYKPAFSHSCNRQCNWQSHLSLSQIWLSTWDAATTAWDKHLLSIILGNSLTPKKHMCKNRKNEHWWIKTAPSACMQYLAAEELFQKEKHNSKAHSTVKSGFCRRWISTALSTTGSWFLQFQVHTNQRSPLHAMSNATGKVTSDSKIKQSTGNAAATASDICLSFSIILGGLLHLSNYKELFPHAPHTTNCKHLTQSSSARDWQRQAKPNSKAHSTVKSGFCKRWISMALSATGSWFLQLQVHTNQRSHHSCNRQCNWQSHLRLKD